MNFKFNKKGLKHIWSLGKHNSFRLRHLAVSEYQPDRVSILTELSLTQRALRLTWGPPSIYCATPQLACLLESLVPHSWQVLAKYQPFLN